MSKTFYLAEKNLAFSDSIMLANMYLADTLWFWEKFKDKLKIVPNYSSVEIWKREIVEPFTFMTVTSFSFYEKAKGILLLLEVVKQVWEKYWDKNIVFHIVGSKEETYFDKIYTKSQSIIMWENIDIIWHWYLEKPGLDRLYNSTNFFLYWSYLDNYPLVLLDAFTKKMNVLVNNFESFLYFIDEKHICNSLENMLEKIDMCLDTAHVYENNVLRVSDVSEKIYKEIILR